VREKIIRFMQGRYGADSFSKFILGLAFVCIILSMFVAGGFFSFLSTALIIYCYFRMFSKNIPKRYQENMLYLKYQNKVLSKFRKFKNEMMQRKTHHIYRCPSCKQKIRVPRGRGKIAIRCPKCSTEFIKKS